MQILYVDESGDAGKFEEGISQNSKHFILSGLIISQEDWLQHLNGLKTFRIFIKEKYGLNLKEEIHASELIRINKIKAYRKIKKNKRIEIFKKFIEELPIIFNRGKVINICFDKTKFESTRDIQELAWGRLIQRFNTYLSITVRDKGIIISDATDEVLVRHLLRKMRVYNPVPSHFGGSRNIPTANILEDPFLRDSKHSYFIQAVDAIAQALYRKEYVKGSLRKHGVDKFFDTLEPILLKEASNNDPFGIVRK